MTTFVSPDEPLATGYESDDDLMAHLPFAPVRERRPDWYGETFMFSLVMLPSINRKHGVGRNNSFWIRPEYEAQEIREGRRIALQREQVGWTCAEHDRYLISYFFSMKSMHEDNHNPLKSTCDILGPGRWKSRGKKREPLWIPLGGVIWNDNRACDEYEHRTIDPHLPTHWARLVVFKYHKSDEKRVPVPDILYDIAKKYR